MCFHLFILCFILRTVKDQLTNKTPKLCKEQLQSKGCSQQFPLSPSCQATSIQTPGEQNFLITCSELAPKGRVSSMWTKQRSRSDKSSADSKAFPCAVSAKGSLQPLLQRTALQVLAWAPSSHREPEEQTATWEMAIRDPCQRSLNTSQGLKSNWRMKDPELQRESSNDLQWDV